MGGYGSLHIHDVNNNINKNIISVYSNPASIFNKDQIHNGYGKPLIIIYDNYTSIYDGSFGIYGDLYRKAMVISKATDRIILGFTESNDDLVGIFLASADKIITEALYADEEWLIKLDAPLFLKKFNLPFSLNDINDLYSTDSVEEFINKFKLLTNISVYIRFNNLPDKLILKSSNQYINIYECI